MICPCGVDHWLWLGLGLQGVVGMMANLDAQGIKPSPVALARLEDEFRKLQVQIEKARECDDETKR